MIGTIFGIIFLIIAISISAKAFISNKKVTLMNMIIFTGFSLISFTTDLFIMNVVNTARTLTTLELSLVIALPFALQAVWRPLLAILSRKTRSRKIPILTACIMGLLLMLISLPLSNSHAQLWLIVVGISFPATTYGFHAQWNLESYSLSKVFATIVIFGLSMFIGHQLSYLVTEANLINNFDYLKTTIIITTILSSLLYIFVRENRSTFHIDENIKNDEFYDYKFLQGFILSFKTGLLVISYIILMNIEFMKLNNIDSELRPIIMFSSLFIGYTLNIIMVKLKFFKIEVRKFQLIILGLMLFLTFLMVILISTDANWILRAVILFMISILFSLASMILYGVAQHADHKNPELIFTLFLSTVSISIGVGEFLSTYISLEVQDYGKEIIAGISCSSIAVLIITTYLANKIDAELFTTSIKYEFSE